MNLKNKLLNLRHRVLTKDIVAIYVIALADVALVATAVSLVLFFI